MTVQTTISRASHDANGSTTSFAFTGKIIEDTDLEVYLVDDDTEEATLQELGEENDYTVEGAGDANGCTVVFNSAPLDGYSVLIKRAMDLTQETSFRNAPRFSPDTHEDALDRLVMIDQQQQTQIDRSLRLPDEVDDYFDADSTPIRNLGAPVQNSDAARLQDVINGGGPGVGAANLVSVSDAGGYYDDANVEAILQEIQTDGVRPRHVQTAAELAAGVTPTNYACEPLPVIDLRRYGTFSDGDNITTVIQTAISVAATTNFKSIAIQFPPGRYLVNTGVFSYDSGDARVGIKWVGAGRNGTTLELQTSSTTQVYFFANSGAVSYRDSYHGIRFLGADVTYCNGWQLNDSATWEKQFHFYDCRFEDLNNLLYTTGTTNADECVFFGCEWYDIRTLVRLDNLQSMLHHFYGCTGTFIGDLIVLEDGGGGEVHYHGGGLIQIPETTVDTYWVRGDAGPATGLSTGNITFNKTRSEQRTQYAKLIYWPVSDSTNRSRQVRIAFDNVNLSQAIQSSGTTRDDWILIGEGKWVVFERCTFPAIASGTLDDVEMTITADNSGAPGVVNPGMITLRDCQVPLDIASNCVITNRYGRFEATGCIPTGTDAADDRTVVNFSKGWATSTQGVSNAPTHRASFLRYSWPLSDGGGGFTGEMTITLPAGAVVTKVSLYKPAQGTASATTQYFISSDDKGTNYCSSTSGRADALHTAVEDDPATLPAGPLAADTVFRLHQTGTSTLIQTGGYAFIEYV